MRLKFWLIKVLAVEPRSKKRSGTAAPSPNLTRLVHNILPAMQAICHQQHIVISGLQRNNSYPDDLAVLSCCLAHNYKIPKNFDFSLCVDGRIVFACVRVLEMKPPFSWLIDVRKFQSSIPCPLIFTTS